MSKLTKAQRKVLEDLREAATFKNASFGGGFDTPDLTDIIKERTLIYRRTWILERIDSLLAGREKEWL